MNVVGVVLAAGLGTRLRPHTDYCPKPLIPVAGVEPLFHALAWLYRSGVRRAVVNAHHLPARIEAALKEWQPLLPGFEMRVSVETPRILGTGGGLIKIVNDHRDWFDGTRGLLLQNGDTLAGISLEKLVGDSKTSTFAVSRDSSHLKRYKPLWTNAAGLWTGIGPTAPHAGDTAAHFLGVHYLSPEAIAAFRGFPVEEVDLFNGVYRPLTDEGFRFRSVSFLETPVEYWFDMNTLEFVLEAQSRLMDRRADWERLLKERFPEIRQAAPGIWVTGVNTNESWISRVRAPAVVAGLGTVSKDLLARFDGGPHVSLVVRGTGASITGSLVGMKNSVLLIEGSSKASATPESVTNEIRVV